MPNDLQKFSSVIMSLVFELFFFRAVLSFYRATAKHGIVVEILSVRPSVRLSVKRVYCDKTKTPGEKVQL